MGELIIQIPVPERMADALSSVITERQRQDKKWGEQNHGNFYWLGILTEELGEVAKEMIDYSDPDDIREELVQLTAVAVAWLECMDRRTP